MLNEPNKDINNHIYFILNKHVKETWKLNDIDKKLAKPFKVFMLI